MTKKEIKHIEKRIVELKQRRITCFENATIARVQMDSAKTKHKASKTHKLNCAAWEGLGTSAGGVVLELQQLLRFHYTEDN